MDFSIRYYIKIMLNPAGKLEALLEKVYEEEKSFEALV